MTTQSVAAERRSNSRIPVTLDAVLYCNTLMLPECRVRDLSPEGAFVLTDGCFFPDRAQVDLVLSLEGGTRMSQRFSGRVMRNTDEGIGLRLEHNSPESLRTLVETLCAV